MIYIIILHNHVVPVLHIALLNKKLRGPWGNI